MNMVDQLFTLPRATAYTQSVQSTIGIMEQTLKAKQLTNASAQSFALFETGLGYWSLGYREAARSVMRTVIRLDSTNFVGALWGIYFARELGDTLESNRLLDRLKSIDRAAQIVVDWEQIRLLGEGLKATKSPREIVENYLALARVYAKIELFDESLDATLKALKLEPSNVDLWLCKGEVFEKKKAFWGAAAAYREVLTLEPHNSFAKTKLDSLLN
jgi:tetratricopeptide (TPR) repeat protein